MELAERAVMNLPFLYQLLVSVIDPDESASIISAAPVHPNHIGEVLPSAIGIVEEVRLCGGFIPARNEIGPNLCHRNGLSIAASPSSNRGLEPYVMWP